MWIIILARNDHQRALLSIPTTNFDTLSVSLHCLALWTVVTEAIYNVRESNNFPRTYAPYFTMSRSCCRGRLSQTSIGIYCYRQSSPKSGRHHDRYQLCFTVPGPRHHPPQDIDHVEVEELLRLDLEAVHGPEYSSLS